jgi:hypothetical protein
MTRCVTFVAGVVLVTCAISNTPAAAQRSRDDRLATREKLKQLLAVEGPKLGITFKQSEKQEFNISGYSPKYANVDYFEAVLTVSADDVIKLRAYPHYKGDYVNVDKARNSVALMRQLLNLNFHNFMNFGTDDSGDIYVGFTFTLESGFPSESITMSLRAIPLVDPFIGRMRPNIDNTSAATTAAP